MSEEVIYKKVEQIRELLQEMTIFLDRSYDKFLTDRAVTRAAERNFQLIIDLAADINAQILIMRGKPTPDSYRQSFVDLGKEKILNRTLAEKLASAARLRNILVHEYDIKEDPKKFFFSAKNNLPIFDKYIRAILEHLSKKT